MTIYDGMALVGMALLGAGLWLVSPPAALCAIGALLLIGGVLGARRSVRTEERRR